MTETQAGFSGERPFLFKLAVLVPAFAVLGWIAIQVIYTFPQADDFCFGARTMDKGLFRSVLDVYYWWSGRFSATFLISLLTSSKTIVTQYYFLGPMFIVLANFLASMYVLKSFEIRNLLFSILFFAILISSYSLRESVFWVSGGITYGFGSALLIALIAAELSIILRIRSASPGFVMALSLSALVLAGFSEAIMIAHVSVLICLFTWSAIFEKDLSWPIGAILAAAVIGAAIVAVAPGNSLRASHLPEPELLPSIFRSLLWIISNYSVLFITTTFLFIVAFLIFLPRSDRLPFTLDWYVWAALFAAIWASAFTRFYSTGGPNVSRTFTIDCALVTMLCFLVALELVKKMPSRRLSTAWFLILTAGFVAAFFSRFTLMDAVFPNRNERGNFSESFEKIQLAAKLNHYMSERIKVLPYSNGEFDEIADRRIKSKAATYFSDITPDPKHWKNTCFARYFNLKKVSLINRN